MGKRKQDLENTKKIKENGVTNGDAGTTSETTSAPQAQAPNNSYENRRLQFVFRIIDELRLSGSATEIPSYARISFDTMNSSSNNWNFRLFLDLNSINLEHLDQVSENGGEEETTTDTNRNENHVYSFLNRLLETFLGVVIFFRPGRRTEDDTNEHNRTTGNRVRASQEEIRDLVVNVFNILSEDIKTFKRGIKKKDLEKIPVVEYDSDETKKCSICLSNFLCGQQVRNLSCEHVFHKDCVDPWLLSSSDTCPMCRKPII